MRIIARSTLKNFWETYPDSEQPLKVWFKVAAEAAWKHPKDVKASFSTASILKDGRVVFNIGGNKYRLVTWITYAYSVVYIRFVGTHEEYDQINAQDI